MFEQLFRNMPPVVKNLLIINVLMFLAAAALQRFGINLNDLFAAHYFESDLFRPYQIVTHFFMHAPFPSFSHILFNMFALVMFGQPLERIWGPKRFLTYYLITAFGAYALHVGVAHYQIIGLVNQLTELTVLSAEEILTTIRTSKSVYADPSTLPTWQALYQNYNGGLVGASGAVFGILLGFAMLFPNTELFLLFLPVPIKAKYLIPIYMIIELYLGINNFSWDNIAHYAHLGGALTGFILLKIWQSKRANFF